MQRYSLEDDAHLHLASPDFWLHEDKDCSDRLQILNVLGIGTRWNICGGTYESVERQRGIEDLQQTRIKVRKVIVILLNRHDILESIAFSDLLGLGLASHKHKFILELRNQSLHRSMRELYLFGWYIQGLF